jgi:hypothetical protein
MVSCYGCCTLSNKQVIEAASLERRLSPIHPVRGCQPIEIGPERTDRIVGWDHCHSTLNGALAVGRDYGA